jgi:hypothetical protein
MRVLIEQESSLADIFSFGVLFWQILTGKTPYEWVFKVTDYHKALHKFLVLDKQRLPIDGITPQVYFSLSPF